MEILSLIISLLTLFVALFLLWKQTQTKGAPILKGITELIQQEQRNSRNELAGGLRGNREEFSRNIHTFQQTFLQILQQHNQQQQQWLNSMTHKVEHQLQQIQAEMKQQSTENREELRQTLKAFQESFTANVDAFNSLQKERFGIMEKMQSDLVHSTENKLERMRETVDEKLHKTLEERLGRSFQLVNEQLQAVQKGLGEMQNLATGVGDLKRVLTNVKTRGVLGEIQLGSILEQIMSPEQYEANVKTKKGSNDLVEFAIKLPGKDSKGQEVFLPIDAKFPQEAYQRMLQAQENGDIEASDKERKILISSIKRFAADIRDKYIDPPYTTDFGIMFLPTEGLFAEIVREPGLVQVLQNDYRIIVTGPTTMGAMLNSLQMGFKTLAIQKRSSEVWEILGAVKAEFGKFGNVLEKAQRKINEANTELDRLVTTRTNVINRKLRDVQELPQTWEDTPEKYLDKID
ncbi:DNA recombination protein RmuC [Algivirga pacifica]|uniref:DNA recombination protein RmuC n=1 Tax=Algivirga pacifica TaxID=1162670 RepID=A0ABP9DQ41_9BACT